MVDAFLGITAFLAAAYGKAIKGRWNQGLCSTRQHPGKKSKSGSGSEPQLGFEGQCELETPIRTEKLLYN